jgi:hypothetical protein
MRHDRLRIPTAQTDDIFASAGVVVGESAKGTGGSNLWWEGVDSKPGTGTDCVASSNFELKATQHW